MKFRSNRPLVSLLCVLQAGALLILSGSAASAQEGLSGEMGAWCGPGATPGPNGPIYAANTVPIRVSPDRSSTLVGLWDRRMQLNQICTRYARQPDGGLLEWRGVADPSGYRGWVSPSVDQLTGLRPPALPQEVGKIPFGPRFFATARDPRFGLNQAWEDSNAADQAGAGWSRLTFWWSAFQYGNREEWHGTATDSDSWINEEIAHGRELAGVVLSTPMWASTNGRATGVPRNLYLPWDHKDNFWGQFMKKLAQKYAGRINTWIIWNEVDIQNGLWHTWDGTVDDYVQLLKVAYQAAKAGNPQAQIAHYGSPWWYDHGAYLGRFLDIIASDPGAPSHNYYFDVGNFHLYSRAADIPNAVPWYREALSARSIPQKPIWIGETNVVPYDDPVWVGYKGGFMASMDEQASYVIQSMAMYVALGVDRVGFNRLSDGQDFRNGGEPFGLLRNDGSRRPAFRAYQVATQLFSQTEAFYYRPPDQTGYSEVRLERPGERITVAWTLWGDSLPFAVNAVGSNALVVGKFGDTRAVAPDESGQYVFDLPRATANTNDDDPLDYVVGGDPLILIERYDGRLAAAPVVLG